MKKDVRVLIVEDDSLVSEMIQGLLEDIKCTVAGKAGDGQQAVNMVQSLQPDVILMDIEMPHMNGIEATRRIYECRPTPVVVLTAYETPELIREASEAGIGAYLIKPPNTRQVERAITIAMARFEDMVKLGHLNAELQLRNKELQEALDKIKTLSGLLPICSSCKKIRDDKGYWQQIEIYITEHSHAEFSHGLCPECMQKLYPYSYEQSIQRRQDIVEVLIRLGQAGLETISAEVGRPTSNTLNRLQNLVKDGQIKQVDVDGRILYELPEDE